MNHLQLKQLKSIFAALLVLLLAGCAYIDAKQGEWIFRPTEATWWGSREIPSTFVEHTIPVGKDGDSIHAWWAPVANKNAPVLLYLHGARWNLTGSVTRIPRWNKMGFSVLAIDYRGFGKSSARTPTEQLAYEDTDAAWAYLQTLAPDANTKKFIFGHSLGGAMATHLAIKQPTADGLILEGTFTNIHDMVKSSKFGFLPVSALITQRFDNLARIDEVTIPVLIAHGTQDTIVPVEMSEKLYAAAKAKKRFFKVEGGSHHNLTSRYFDDYAAAVWSHFGLQQVASSVDIKVGSTR
jgi:uncharacterized protein